LVLGEQSTQFAGRLRPTANGNYRDETAEHPKVMPLEPNESGAQLVHKVLISYELDLGASPAVAAVLAAAAFFWAIFSRRWPRGCGCQQN
jgi:hypothetical protein